MGSVTDEMLSRNVISQCDYIYHLAATIGVKNVVDHPLETITHNIHETELILRYAFIKKIGVLITSTSEVYGKAPKLSLKENGDFTLGPPTVKRWSYACSKALDEFLGIAYHREHGLRVTLVRLFNIVGPGQVGHYGMVVPRFFKAALSNEPMYVYGDGNQRRCFTYVDEAVKILIKLASLPKAAGEITNIGSNQEISIKQLAHKIKSITESSSRIVYSSYSSYYGKGFEDIRRRRPDVTKLKRIAGTVPKMSIDQILLKLKKYYMDNPKEFERL
ncbi:MAG: NAD-dependent epimerase/dehydratase family protein [Candidatus Omnitrophota bacterium]